MNDESVFSELIEETRNISTWLHELTEWHKDAEKRNHIILERQADAMELIADRLEKLGTVIERSTAPPMQSIRPDSPDWLTKTPH